MPSAPAFDTLFSPDGSTRLVVSRLGAEPVSFARLAPDGSWTGFLWRDGLTGKPDAGWGNHCTVMAPYIHRLVDGRSLYDGQPVTGGTHSFIRHHTFSEPEKIGNQLVYHFQPGEIPPDAFPRAFSLRLAYTLHDSGTWEVEFLFSNPAAPLHLSFGLHPGFALTSIADYRLNLPAGRYLRHLAPGNFLSGQTETFTHPGGEAPLDRSLLLDSYLLDLAALPPAERVFTLHDPPSGRRLRLHYEEAPYLTVWSDGNPFLCVEPCWGLPDHQHQRPFQEKSGLQVIPPGETLRASVRIVAETGVF